MAKGPRMSPPPDEPPAPSPSPGQARRTAAQMQWVLLGLCIAILAVAAALAVMGEVAIAAAFTGGAFASFLGFVAARRSARPPA